MTSPGGPKPGVTVIQPASGARLAPGQPLHVTGFATGKAGLEADPVRTVTVSVDGGPPTKAALTIVQKLPAPPEVSFDLALQGPSDPGPHGIDVVATLLNSGATLSAHVSVQVWVKTFTPRDSLLVSVLNQPPPSAGDWATDIVNTNQSPVDYLPSLLHEAIWDKKGLDYPACAREWVQVLAPADDYDVDPVGFSGWVLQPELSQGDVPFSHPFGFDWECMVALDPEYTSLLAAGNVRNDGADGDQAREDAAGLNIPVPDGGLFAVETDGNCVPSALKYFGDTVRVGDRIAAFGRWIVDAAHHVDLTGGGTSYRAEVHPPLLMAIGGTRSTETGDVTRIIVTSRPYLVKQVYTTDTDTIYDDSDPGDGTLLTHMDHEFYKLTHTDWEHAGFPESVTIEAHPKIAAKPFQGEQQFRLSVRPPSAGHVGPGGQVGVGPAGQVEVSFQFTCRSGVTVTVLGLGDHAELIVDLPSDYQAPKLPPAQDDSWTKGDLEAIEPGGGEVVLFEQIANLFLFLLSIRGLAFEENVQQALLRGVKTEHYDVSDVNALDSSHAVPFVPVSQIPAGQGVVIDDSQPYPVFGFIEIRRLPHEVLGGNHSEVSHASLADHPQPPEALT